MLLRTKLIPPSVTASAPRQRVLALLDAASDHQLTLLAAPAGSGKTTALAQWAQHTALPVAWLTLDAADADPARFWPQAIAAMLQAAPELGEDLGTGATRSLTSDVAITMLLNALVKHPTPLALVIDEMHTVDGTCFFKELARLIELAPPHLHLILSSRRNPPLPLARIRAQGMLAEVRLTDLSFTLPEATVWLNELISLNLASDDIAALVRCTEGWATGLHLAAITLRHSPHEINVLTARAGSHHVIADYLIEEVFARQPLDVQHFLLDTALLDELAPAICDAMTERTNSAALLAALEHDQLFLVPLDGIHTAYCYHQVFGDFLRTRLHRTQPARLALLHRRAAAWYDAHNQVAAALRHLFAVGDIEVAGRLIAQHGAAFVRRGECVTLLEWLRALPLPLIERHARLCLLYAWALAATLHIAAAEHWLSQAQRHLTAENIVPADHDTFVDELMLVRAYIETLGGTSQQQLPSPDLPRDASPGSDGTFVATLRVLLEGDGMEHAAALTATVDPGRADNDEALALAHLHATQAFVGGRLQAAVRGYQQALILLKTRSRPPRDIFSIVAASLSMVRRAQHDLAAALELGQTAVACGRDGNVAHWQLGGLLALAQAQQAAGDIGAAQASIVAATHLVETTELPPWMSGTVLAERGRLALLQGDVPTAASWAHSYLGDGAATSRYPALRKMMIDLLLARVLLALGDADAAQRTASDIYALADKHRWQGVAIESSVLMALAWQAQGHTTRAQQIAHKALMVSAQETFVQPFVEGGPLLFPLVRAILPSSLSHARVELRPFLARVFAVLDSKVLTTASPGKPMPRPHSATLLAEPLSSREQDVLRLLAEGLSNQAIAKRLIIGAGTVKTHLMHIYGKLDVHSRTEAVVRAQALGLV